MAHLNSEELFYFLGLKKKKTKKGAAPLAAGNGFILTWGSGAAGRQRLASARGAAAVKGLVGGGHWRPWGWGHGEMLPLCNRGVTREAEILGLFQRSPGLRNEV